MGWFDNEQLRTAVGELFERNGVDVARVFVVSPSQADEAIFVVKSAVGSALPELTLTRELMALLHSRVWIATFGPEWGERLRPLG